METTTEPYATIWSICVLHGKVDSTYFYRLGYVRQKLSTLVEI